MNDKALWGLVIIVYIAPFAGFEIWRQARRGEGYEPDRITGIGWAGFAVLLALWAIHVPALLVILLAIVAGLIAAGVYGFRVLRRAPPQ